MATSKTPARVRATPGRSRTTPSPANPFLALLNDVRGDLEARLCGFLDAAVDQATAYGADLVAWSGRSVTCVSGAASACARPWPSRAFRATGTRQPLGPALDAGVALELLHAYLLIHDDWMDQDAIRRGGPTVHTLLAKRYRSSKPETHRAFSRVTSLQPWPWRRCPGSTYRRYASRGWSPVSPACSRTSSLGSSWICSAARAMSSPSMPSRPAATPCRAVESRGAVGWRPTPSSCARWTNTRCPWASPSS